MPAESPTSAAGTAWRRSPQAATVAAIAITAFALLLRLHNLGEESLWNDELTTYGMAAKGPLSALIAAARDTGPPLYYLLQSVVLRILPPNEVTLRIIPALAGTAAVWVTYLVGRRLYDPLVGLIAAGFLAVAGIPLLQSQEARSYAPATLAVLIVVWTLLRLAERPGQRGMLVAHAVAVAAAAYTHLFGLISCLGVALGVVLAGRLRRRLGRSWVVAFSVGLALWLPWAFVMIAQIMSVAARSASGEWSVPVPDSILRSAVVTAQRFALWESSGPRWLAVPFVAVAVIGLLPALRLVTRRRRDEDDRADSAEIFRLTVPEASVLVAAWLGTVFIGGPVCSKYLLPIFSWRMAGIAAPALYLAAAAGLARAWRPAAVVFIALLLVYSLPGVRDYYTQTQKEDWSTLSTFMVQHNVSATGVIASPQWMLANVVRYTEIHGTPTRFPDQLRVMRSSDVSQVAAQVGRYLVGRDEVYVLLAHEAGAWKSDTTVDRALRSLGWTEAENRGYKGVWLRRYERAQ